MIKKKLKSYRRIFTRDFTQRLYISRYENYENDYYENEIYVNCINIKNCFSNFNNSTNKVIFKLIINVSRVKIKVINFMTFSFLLRNKFDKDYFINIINRDNEFKFVIQVIYKVITLIKFIYINFVNTKFEIYKILIK